MQCSLSRGFIMAANKKVDLRIQRTKDSIRKTFEEMICEMDYEQILSKNWHNVPESTEKHSIYTTTP